MSWKESLNEALFELIKERGVKDAVRVTGWSEETEGGGSCASCYYEEVVVYIYYVDDEGFLKQHVYIGSFAELINLL